MPTPTCHAPDCQDKTKARGLCLDHYRKAVRDGLIVPTPLRTTGTLEEAFWAKVRKHEEGDGCWEWTGAMKSQRGECGRFWYRGRRLGFAHRMAWGFVNGLIPDDVEVLRWCGNPRCVRAERDPATSHLFLGTGEDRMALMVAHGRAIWTRDDTAARAWREAHLRPAFWPQGGHAKLTEEEVREALLARARGEGLKEIAQRMGVHLTTIWRATEGPSWLHLRKAG